MGKSLSSDSARARSQKQQKEASRRAAPDARERIPTGAGGAARSYQKDSCEGGGSTRFIAKSSTWAGDSPGARRQLRECESVNDSPLRCAAKSRRDSCPRDPQILLGNVTFCRRSAANDRHISPRQRFQAKQLSRHMRRKVIPHPESTAECTAHLWHLLARRNTPGARLG